MPTHKQVVEAHGVKATVYIRPDRSVKVSIDQPMRLKDGPHTMFGADFANVELEPKLDGAQVND
jgi:hypothetical protein